MKIGQKIKTLRLSNGIKQKDLAEAISIGATYLCAIEHCSKQPSLKLLNKIAKYFNCQVEIEFLNNN